MDSVNLRVVLGSLGPAGGDEAAEAVEGAVELALKAGLHAVEVAESAGFSAVGVGLAGAARDGDFGGGGAQEVEFVIDADGFEVREAQQAPAGGDHHIEQHAFGGAFGLMFEVEAAGEDAEAVGILAFEQDAFGEGAVAVGIAGCAGLAFFGAGSCRFLRVGAISFKLFVGDHESPLEYCGKSVIYSHSASIRLAFTRSAGVVFRL